MWVIAFLRVENFPVKTLVYSVSHLVSVLSRCGVRCSNYVSFNDDEIYLARNVAYRNGIYYAQHGTRYVKFPAKFLRDYLVDLLNFVTRFDRVRSIPEAMSDQLCGRGAVPIYVDVDYITSNMYDIKNRRVAGFLHFSIPLPFRGCKDLVMLFSWRFLKYGREVHKNKNR
mgnify:FL=1